MNTNPTNTSRIPLGIFLGVFIFVFTLVFGISIITTSLSPKSYRGAARVEVTYKSTGSGRKTFYDSTLAQTECEAIKSELVMRRVIDDLNLDEAWGKKFGVGTLKTWESLKLLEGITSIHPVPNTTLIEIDVFDDSPDDAATLANSIAKIYTSYIANNNQELEVQIIDSAYADKIPVRPNKPLNYFLGIVTGIFLGLLAGGLIALIVFIKSRKASKFQQVNLPQTNIPDPPP
jgi:capsular polysaccharide biosynthesis protein